MNNATEWAPANATAATSANGVDLLQLTITEKVEIIIYTVCFLVGAPLNARSFMKLLRSMKKTRKASAAAQITLLRLNLNIADLLTMFIYTTSQIIWMITYQWYGGDLLCRICKFFHTFGFYLNSFVIACIAIDRVLGTYNLSTLKASRRSYMRCRKMLVVAWVFAIFLSLPQAFIFRVFEPPAMGNFKQCTPIWTILCYEIDLQGTAPNVTPSQLSALLDRMYYIRTMENIYNVAHLFFVFWIPALIVLASYSIILCMLAKFTLRKDEVVSMKTENGDCMKTSLDERSPSVRDLLDYRTRSMSTASVKFDNSHRRSTATQRVVGQFALQTITRARQRAKTQAAFIIAAYLSFWSPYNLVALVNALFFDGTSANENPNSVTNALPFLNSLIVVNPIVNPLIYGLFEKHTN